MDFPKTECFWSYVDAAFLADQDRTSECYLLAHIANEKVPYAQQRSACWASRNQDRFSQNQLESKWPCTGVVLDFISQFL